MYLRLMRCTFILTLLLIITYTTSSQCIIPSDGFFSDDTLVIGKNTDVAFGSYFTGSAYIINESPDCKMCRIELKEVEVSDTIRKAVRQFIRTKSGQIFLDHCEIDKIMLVHPQDEKKFGKNNYHYKFSWHPNIGVSYTFGVTLDEKGKVLSKPELPEIASDTTLRPKHLCELYDRILKAYPECRFYSVSLNLKVSKNKKTMYYEFDFSNATKKLEGKGLGCHDYCRYNVKADLFSGEISKMKKSKATICVD
jgi:hypothetical protein